MAACVGPARVREARRGSAGSGRLLLPFLGCMGVGGVKVRTRGLHFTDGFRIANSSFANPFAKRLFQEEVPRMLAFCIAFFIKR